MVYADNEFYLDRYLLGRKPLILEGTAYYMRAASQEMDKYLQDGIEEYPELVGLCCCEVAEAIYRYEQVTGGTSAPLVSYGNDGRTGQFDLTDYTRQGHQRKVYGIIRRYFEDTGLLFQGVSR